MSTTEQLHAYLFGTFRLVRDGIEVSSKDWHTRQARQLFKVLLQEQGRLVPTRKLIDLLWPENVENAHKALRSAVSALRDVLEPEREPWLSSKFVPRGQSGYSLTFPSNCEIWIDVLEFNRLLDAGLQGRNTPEMRTCLEQALALYTGDYLTEDGETAWVVRERIRLRERYCAGALRLMQWYGEEDRYQEAIELGRQALDRDVCCEPLYRFIMRYQALAGDKAAALLTFQRCQRALADHLGADPSPQTLDLHMAILNGALPEQSFFEIAAPNDPGVQRKQHEGTNELAQRLLEAQEQAVHYTMQAADYARRAYIYRQALADYDAASRLLQVQGVRYAPGQEGSGSAQWWGRLYHGRGLVYEALLDWQGIQENHAELSIWAASKRDLVLAHGSVQRMIVNRSLMGYLSEALGMGREFMRQLQMESENQPKQNVQTRESLRLLSDLAGRLERMLDLDDSNDQVPISPSLFPPFLTATPPCVHDWERASDILGPSQAAFILTSYGLTLLLQGLRVDTEHCLQAARHTAAATGQVTWEILASSYLSQAYAFSGQHEQAARAFGRCMDLCHQVSELAWVTIWPLLNRAYYLMSLGQLDEAERTFSSVRQQLKGQDLPAYRCSLRIGLGLLALARQQLERAHKLLSSTLAQKQSVYIEVYVLAEIGLAQIAQRRGDYREARERLYTMLAFTGKRSLLYLYASSAFALARLNLKSQVVPNIASLLEQVRQLVTTAGAVGLARECRLLQAQYAIVPEEPGEQATLPLEDQQT